VKSLITVCELVVAFVHPDEPSPREAWSTVLTKPRQATTKE
jgi:hypothetical protein